MQSIDIGHHQTNATKSGHENKNKTDLLRHDLHGRLFYSVQSIDVCHCTTANTKWAREQEQDRPSLPWPPWQNLLLRTEHRCLPLHDRKHKVGKRVRTRPTFFAMTSMAAGSCRNFMASSAPFFHSSLAISLSISFLNSLSYVGCARGARARTKTSGKEEKAEQCVETATKEEGTHSARSFMTTGSLRYPT